MAINIKDPKTDRLVRELADATGESITEAARVAIAERLARVKARAVVPAVRQKLEQIIERGRKRPTLDDRTADDVIGYDDLGLPS